jgi:small subunit ribosomal protein S4
MARYTGPKWRINRREGAQVLGTGEKWRRRSSVPGMHGRSARLSDYGVLFREKQKVKRMYGMQERQFRRFFALARKSTGNTGTRFLQLLELRLDNVLFRLGYAETRPQARQLVAHGHVTLNGKKHNVPSTIVKPGDEIKLKASFLNSPLYQMLNNETRAATVPAWLERYSDGGKVLAEPTRDLIDQSIKERLIIELYSK